MFAGLLVLGLALTSPQIDSQARDAEAIEAAKRTSVHQIEASLPDKTFARWLQDLVGTQGEIEWEVNDCGEQAGNPSLDRDQDFPMCAEAQVALGGKRKLSVALSVGTFKTGVKTGPASFFSAVVVEPNGSRSWLKNLSRVPDAIKAK
jgi:hypothetical protein